MDMDSLVLAARTALALACVLGLIWVVARKAGWGKAGRRATGPAIEVVGRQALGRHAGVAVLAVGERRLLVGFGEQQVTMLSELDPVIAEAEAPAPVAEQARSTTPLFSWRKPAGPVASTPDFESTLADVVASGPGPAAPAPDSPQPPATPAATAALAAANSALAAAARLNAAAAVPTQPSPGEHTTVPGLAGARVADIDPADLAPGTEPAAVHGGPLDGSILAPATWKQAVSALRERTVRR